MSNGPYFIFWSIVMSLIGLLMRHYFRKILALLQEIRDIRAANRSER